MSDHYPPYPGEDPGPVAPPPVQQPPVLQPPVQHPQARHPAAQWQPPPEPQRPPEGAAVRPAAVTAAVWTMVAGAVTTIASTVVGLYLVDHMTELVARDLQADPTLDAAFIDGFTSVFTAAMIVIIALTGLVGVIVWLWMAWKNAQGRSWARITATCLGALAVAGTVSSGGLSAIDYATSGLPLPSTGLLLALGLVTAASLAVSALAVILLWLKPSSAYVAAVTAQRRWRQWSRQYGHTHAGQ
ncbi:hypothetical protein [Aeromicrobium sp. CTD01-1L150]|uniref:hypothetical protein n=1 Tax=Aeromicrobium sp. CTD01-1L150 TaxID=3341830 RepID=UPI0035C0D780